MKLIRNLIVAASIGSFALTANAQGQLNPITKAMMDTYQKIIDENPQDYETYLKRATEYYRHDQYLRALNDVNEALKYIPEGDTDWKVQALELRANIYQNTDRPQEALVDLNAALALSPQSYMAIYQKANLEYELGQYANAKASYQKLYRISPRSLEALFGIARVAVKESNYGMATEYADQAVNTAPSQSDVYTRRASIRQSMGNNTGAVEDLILALSTDSNDKRALRDLIKMGNVDYTAVMAGLGNAIRQAPNVGMFYYLRAVIAMEHYRYKDALNDFKTIVDQNLYNFAGIYQSMAGCNYALGNYIQASSDIEYAIASTDKNADYYIELAKIRRAQWRSEDALTAINKSLEKQSNNHKAQAEKALILVDLERYQEASDAIGEATIYDADNAYYYLVRAWILSEYLNQPVNAKLFCDRVITSAPDNKEPIKSLEGFALLFKGEKDAAISWIEKILAETEDKDGYINYLATCLYAQSEMSDKAFAAMEKALEKGYANRYDWERNNDARINVNPLRNDARFNSLLEKYKSIF